MTSRTERTQDLRTTEFGTFVKKLTEQVVTEEWQQSVDAQVASFKMLKKLSRWVPPDLYASTAGLLAQGLGITQERAEHILALDRQEEMRRSIKFRTAKPMVWLKEGEWDERNYPDAGFLGKYMRWAQGAEVPLAWHFWMGCAVLGAACRRNIYMDRNNHYLRPNYYLMIVGPSGLKKDQAVDTGIDLLYRLNRKLEEKYPDPSGQGNIDQKTVALLPKRSTPERFLQMAQSREIVDTSAGLIDRRWTDSIGVIANGELVTMLGKSTYGAEGFLQLLTALYTCPPEWTNSTIGRGDEVLKNVALTFIGGSTLDWLRTSIDESMFGGGFMGRCIFVPRQESGRQHFQPNILDPVTAEVLADMLMKLADMEQREWVLGPDAFAWMEAWYYDHKDKLHERDPRMVGYFQRKDAHVLRLAMVLAISDGVRLIGTLDDVQTAMKIIEDEERRLPGAFVGMGANSKSVIADRVMETLYREGGLVKHSKLLKKTAHFVGDARDFERVVETLRAQQRLEIQRVKGEMGKTSRQYRLIGGHDE